MRREPKILKAANAEIKYEYRPNRGLLIFTNFENINLLVNRFADGLEGACSQIESMNQITHYDLLTSAIIATMITGYNESISDAEIANYFNQFFN